MRHITVLLTAAMIIIAALTACSKPIEKMSAAELLDLGEKYLIEMNYEQAIVYFEKLIEVEQMNPRGYTGMAAAYIGQENYDGAIGALRSGTELLPDNTFLADAAELYEEIIDKAPLNPDGYIELANIYIVLGDEEKAVETLRRGMEQLPDNAEIRTLLESLEFTNMAESKEDEVDWRQIYFDSYHEIIRDAVTYTGSNFTETEIDSIDSMRLADINFDGVPELTICPYSPTGTYGLIYMIIEGQVKRVFSDSFNEYSWQLKRNTTSGEYEYVLHTNIGAYGWDNGGLYIMMPQITYDENLKENSEVGTYKEEHLFDSDGNEIWDEINGYAIDESRSSYTFMGESVTKQEYESQTAQMLSLYEDIDYTPDIVTRGGRLSREFITWVSDGEEEFILVPDIPKTDEEINLFLNSYRKEKD